MKKVIKKITAITLAFTILGTGSAVIKNSTPKSDNTIIAYAGGVPQQYCSHSYAIHDTKNDYYYCEACGKNLGKKLPVSVIVAIIKRYM